MSRKKCFVITPIGNDTDPIRRHIEGIIDAAICPALDDEYDVIVAHKISDPGSITKQIITEIYNDELVIANLTNRNPNVMYELAFRHCLGKPVITIAEKGTSLPSDIIMERTIFYHNDAQGTIELRDELKKAVKSIDFNKTSSPIHDVLHEIDTAAKIIEISKKNSKSDKVVNDESLFEYIIERLDRIEGKVASTRTEPAKSRYPYEREFVFEFSGSDIDIDSEKLYPLLKSSVSLADNYDIIGYSVNPKENMITISIIVYSTINLHYVRTNIRETLEKYGLFNVKYIRDIMLPKIIG